MKLVVFIGILFFSITSVGWAQQHFEVGAHVGGIDAQNDSGIGYGVHLLSTPSDVLGIELDLTLVPLGAGTMISSSPALVGYFANYEEFKIGALGGPGFYSLPADRTRFGLHLGVTGEFMLDKLWSAGMEARLASVFGVSKNILGVFLTMGYHFSAGSDW